MQALEERFLFLLFLLRHPRLRVIYLTGRPVPESDRRLLPRAAARASSRARRARRLHMVAAHDGSRRSLAEKLLERPRVLAEVRALIPDPALCHLVPVLDEQARARPRADARHPALRRRPAPTCRSARRPVAGACSRTRASAHPLGHEDLHDLDDVVDALRGHARARRRVASAIVKLNEGVAGRGNATVDLPDLPAPGAGGERAELRRRSRRWRSSTPTSRCRATSGSWRADGGIVEERVGGTEMRSPSVQLRVTPLGEVELLSTHDQLLGGPSGQKYLGCRFPADFGYAQAITREAAKIGERAGARGRARPLRRRLRRRPRPRRRRGRRTRSSSTCARAARRIRS